MSLERFKEMMRRNKETAKAFNIYAAEKGVVLFEDATFADHEQGWLRIGYRTIDARFGYTAEMSDEDQNYTPHFLAALTSGQAQPNNIFSSTSIPTEAESERMHRATEAAKQIKAPLAERAAT